MNGQVQHRRGSRLDGRWRAAQRERMAARSNASRCELGSLSRQTVSGGPGVSLLGGSRIGSGGGSSVGVSGSSSDTDFTPGFSTDPGTSQEVLPSMQNVEM